MCLTGKTTLNRPRTSYWLGVAADTAVEAAAAVADVAVVADTAVEAAEGAAAVAASGLGPA